MFAEYHYNDTPTPANVFQDIIDILTGETDTGNLSADCDTGNSVINTDYTTSPWVVHDAATDLSDKQIIKTTQTDSGDVKYLGIRMTTGTTPKPIVFSVMSAWDAGTNVGTNFFELPTIMGCAFQELETGQIWIYADEFSICMMQVEEIGQYGNEPVGSSSSYGTILIGEHMRGPSTQIGDQPNWFVANTANIAGPQHASNFIGYAWSGRNMSTSNVLSLQTPFSMGLGIWGRNMNNNSGTYLDFHSTLGQAQARAVVDGTVQYLPQRIIAGAIGYPSPNLDATACQDVSARCDIWALPDGSVAVGSLMNFNGKKYKIWKGGFTTNTTGTSVGNCKIMIPHG